MSRMWVRPGKGIKAGHWAELFQPCWVLLRCTLSFSCCLLTLWMHRTFVSCSTSWWRFVASLLKSAETTEPTGRNEQLLSALPFLPLWAVYNLSWRSAAVIHQEWTKNCGWLPLRAVMLTVKVCSLTFKSERPANTPGGRKSGHVRIQGTNSGHTIFKNCNPVGVCGFVLEVSKTIEHTNSGHNRPRTHEFRTQ